MDFSEEDKKRVYEVANQLVGLNHVNHEEGILPLQVWKRMQDLNHQFQSLDEYISFALINPLEKEKLISLLTIHTTYWFREKKHFEFIEQQALKFHETFPRKLYRVWCAAASSGEEVYSVAFVLEAIKKKHPEFTYEIYGTDIDKTILETAKKAIYPQKYLKEIPERFHEYILEGSGKTIDLIAIHKKIRERIHFRTHNLIDNPISLGKFNLILCRNVLLYFSQQLIKKVISYLLDSSHLHGHIILGMSESLASPLPSNLKHVENTLYQVVQDKSKKNPVKIIFLDDEEDMIMLYQTLISSSNLEIEAFYAQTTEEADKIIKENSLSLLIFDLNLGTRSADDYLIQLRARGVKTPAMIVTGYGELNQNTLTKLLSSDVLEIIDKLTIFKETNFLLLKIKSFIGAETKDIHPFVIPQKHIEIKNIKRPEVIAIGASTGGVQAITQLLVNLPNTYPPIILVQHISVQFSQSLARQMTLTTTLPCSLMEKDFQELKSGHIYMALGDYHLHLVRENEVLGLRKCSNEKLARLYCPSIDELFFSMIPYAHISTALLLTGMGRDGAEGICALKNAGAFTMVQDEASSVVFGMPKEAIKLGGAKMVGNISELREWLDELCLVL